MKQGVIVLLVVLGVILGTIWSSSIKRVQVMEVTGPKMYLDQMFGAVTKTAGIEYSMAPAYKTKVATKMLLDIYEPVGDSRVNRPALILIHGGGFATGNRGIYDEEKNGGLFGWGKYFAERGYVVFSVDYRLGDKMYKLDDPDLKAVIKMSTSDILSSIRYVRLNAAKYRVEPNRIAVGGNSAGAILALYSAYHQGPSGDNIGNLGPSDTVSAVISLSGTLGLEDLNLINSSSAPAVMFAGQTDQTVPYAWSEAVKNKLNDSGVRVDWYSYPGVGHVVAGYLQVAPDVAKFLYEVMRLDTSVATPKPSLTPSPEAISLASPSKLPVESPRVVASPIASLRASATPSLDQAVDPSLIPSASPSMPPSSLPSSKSVAKIRVEPSIVPSPVEVALERLPPEDFVWSPGNAVEAKVESNALQIATKQNILVIMWEKIISLFEN